MKKSQHQGPFIDELAARRMRSGGQEGAPEEPVRGEWKDVLAMVIIAYQVVMPYLLVMIGVMVVLGFLFIWFFKG